MTVGYLLPLSLCHMFALSSTFLYASVFFFQAEDGIRDLVRSRGLGDVYKRQLYEFKKWLVFGFPYIQAPMATGWLVWDKWPGVNAVSYTHLTLPTSDLV